MPGSSPPPHSPPPLLPEVGLPGLNRGPNKEEYLVVVPEPSPVKASKWMGNVVGERVMLLQTLQALFFDRKVVSSHQACAIWL